MTFIYNGILKAHQDWITSLVCPPSSHTAPSSLATSPNYHHNKGTKDSHYCSQHVLVSAGRDKSIIFWKRETPLSSTTVSRARVGSRHDATGRDQKQTQIGQKGVEKEYHEETGERIFLTSSTLSLSESLNDSERNGGNKSVGILSQFDGDTASSASSSSISAAATLIKAAKRIYGHAHFVSCIALGNPSNGQETILQRQHPVNYECKQQYAEKLAQTDFVFLPSCLPFQNHNEIKRDIRANEGTDNRKSVKEKAKIHFYASSVINGPTNPTKADKNCLDWSRRELVASASWDTTVQLWDRKTGESLCKLCKLHEKEVLSVAFAPHNAGIISAGSDGRLILSTLTGHVVKSVDGAHGGGSGAGTPWISCIKMSPREDYVVTAGWDGTMRVWDYPLLELLAVVKTNKEGVKQKNEEVDLEMKENDMEEICPITCLEISPDGSLCVTGDKKGRLCLWELPEHFSKMMPFITETTCNSNQCDHILSQCSSSTALRNNSPCHLSHIIPHICTINTHYEINSICFCPTRNWIAAATDQSILVYRIGRFQDPFAELVPEQYEGLLGTRKTVGRPHCKCLAWSDEALYSGYSDNTIRRWVIVSGGGEVGERD